LTKDEQYFIEMILAFFAASDGIVNFNLSQRFLQEIMVVESRTAYCFQMMMENIHSEVYSDMLLNIVKNPERRKYLFDAIKTVPAIKSMADWALKWISSKESIGHRIIAFAIVEGIFFSGAFAAIFWLKKTRGKGTLFMEGLIKSNRFISRDEMIHTYFAIAQYTFVSNRVPENDVFEMVKEAVKISEEFNENAIKVKLIGIDMNSMTEYIKVVADRLLVMLGYNKLFKAINPFDFMESIGLLSKDNFFETRPDSYQKTHNENNTASWEFEIAESF
jgi:ribonucleotide reductase beta subunit family protein with ferritin-like domain